MPWHKPRVRENGDDVVVLVHGLWRSLWAMEPMARRLHEEGFSTVNFPYASFRLSLDGMAARLLSVVKGYEGRRVHFVTHSLGGVVARRLLGQVVPDGMGRVVMLAPPHGGSEIVDWLGKVRMRGVLGPAGRFLSSDFMQGYVDVVPAEVETAVIMGRRSLLPFFRGVLDAENDGIVSVERGRVEGMNAFEVVDADHTFISSEDGVMAMTARFLREGTLREGGV